MTKGNLSKQPPGDLSLQQIPMKLTAIIGRSPAGDDYTQIEKRLRQLMGELGEDLGVLFDLQLQLRAAEADELDPAEDHRLLLDGTPCRVERNSPLATGDAPRAIANAVMETLYRNRSLLVTQGLVEAVLQILGAGQATEDTKILVRTTLLQAIERCFDIPEAIRLCRILLDDPDQGEYEMELQSAIRFSRTLQVEFGRHLYDAAFTQIDNPEESGKYLIDQHAGLLRDGLFYELGIRLPPFEFSFSEELREEEFRIRINRLRCPPQKGLNADEVLVNDSVERLALLNIDKAQARLNPANGLPAATIPAEYEGLCQQAGLITWDCAGYAILSISAVMRRHASALFTLSHTEYNLDQLNQAFPQLVFNVLERFHMLTLTKVFRSLLVEEISIRDLRSVLEAMLELNGTIDEAFERYILFSAGEAHLAATSKAFDELSAEEIAEYVRSALKRYISLKYARGSNNLIVYLLDPLVESHIRESDRLQDQERERLLQAVESEIGSLASSYQTPVILTTICVRGKLRRELALSYPRLAVLSYQELTPDLNIQPMARISWPEEASPA